MASKAEIEEWFKQFDADGSGKIEAKELKTVVKQYREWQSLPNDDAAVDADVGAILKDVDTSGDGKLDKNEFVKFFSS